MILQKELNPVKLYIPIKQSEKQSEIKFMRLQKVWICTFG